MMTEKRLAKIQILAKSDLLLEELFADYRRLRGELAARGQAVELTEAELELIVDALGRYENDDDGAANTLYRRLISTYFRASRSSTTLTCDGCGVAPTSTHDADGNHLCRDCGESLAGENS